MKYKCIKNFSVEKYDDDCFLVENEYCNIEKGSIWETDQNNFHMVGGNEHILLWNINDCSWLEIIKETLLEYFEEVKE